MEKVIAYKGHNNKVLYIGDSVGKQVIVSKSFYKVDKKTNKNRSYIKVKCECGNTRDILIKKLSITNSCQSCRLKRISPNYKGLILATLTSFKAGAEKRNLEFSITIEDIYNQYIKQNKKCNLSGLDLIFNTKKYLLDGNASIDRIDSSKGYTINNIQIIHKDINKMKMDLNQEYFINLCKLISKK